jgi:hypothetical protein
MLLNSISQYSFILIPIVIFLFCALILTIWSYVKWVIAKTLLSKISVKDYLLFENLKVSTISNWGIQYKVGFPLKARLLISQNHLLILPSRMAFFLFQSSIPNEFIKAGIKDNYKVKLNSWNSVTFVCKEASYPALATNIEFLIETNNPETKLKLFEQLKNWC